MRIHGNCLLEISTQLLESLEKGAAESAKTSSFVGGTTRGEVNSPTVPLESASSRSLSSPEAVETSSEAVAKDVKNTRFVKVTIRPVPRNCVLEVTQLPEVIESI